MCDRAERYAPAQLAVVHLSSRRDDVGGTLSDISRSGLACEFDNEPTSVVPGTPVSSIRLSLGPQVVHFGSGSVVRTAHGGGKDAWTVVAVAFDQDQLASILELGVHVRPYRYVTGELAQAAVRAHAQAPTSNAELQEQTLDQFSRSDDRDILAKCRKFRNWTGGMKRTQVYQRLYRVTATGALDSRITVFDPIARRERVFRCFDSNSYLGLHMHPRVIDTVQRTLKQTGYGTPSAQLLGGTSRYLRELEEQLSDMHGREEAIVFPTGYAANTGTIAALVRDQDAAIYDRHAHASIRDGSNVSRSRLVRRFEHNDMDELDDVLSTATRSGATGKLVATEGVFSMHGELAPLPALVAACRRHGARLMIDDAHGLGVLGGKGRGIEEHFDMRGEVDVLMGTLSKSVGSLGGYVCGDRDLISYLRWFASSSMFTTAPPAALCAGMREALMIIEEEPEHREALWSNLEYFARTVREVGLIAPEPESPILPIYIGPQGLLWKISKNLFEAGVKASSMMYPAVAKDEAILRFVVNARHTREDLDVAIDALSRCGRAEGILGSTREEIHARWHEGSSA